MRWIILLGVVYWTLTSIYMLLRHGEELDLDTVFPFVAQEIGRTVSYGPTPVNPPAVVTAAFWATGIIIGFPIVFSGKAAVIALRTSIVVVGIFLAASILRLGILLVPVFALQLLAHSRLATASNS